MGRGLEVVWCGPLLGVLLTVAPGLACDSSPFFLRQYGRFARPWAQLSVLLLLLELATGANLRVRGNDGRQKKREQNTRIGWD